MLTHLSTLVLPISTTLEYHAQNNKITLLEMFTRAKEIESSFQTEIGWEEDIFERHIFHYWLTKLIVKTSQIKTTSFLISL